MNCPTCRQSPQVLTAKTERNRGRKFVSCKRHTPQYFAWISDREREAVEFAQKTVNRILAGTPQLVKPILNDAAPLTGSDETTSTPPENGNENKTGAGLSKPISGAGGASSLTNAVSKTDASETTGIAQLAQTAYTGKVPGNSQDDAPTRGVGLAYLSQLDDDEVPDAPVVKKQFTLSAYQVAGGTYFVGG